MTTTMRDVLWALRAAVAVALAPAVLIAGPFLAASDVASAAPAAVTVPEASVLSSPYTVELAPGGELRVLSFPDALVSSVVVAKPWLLTVLVQGHDVVLQAKASSGETQVIAYAGGAGTLWNVVIAPHKPVASRIVVSASPREAAVASPPSAAQAGTGPASPESPPMSSGLAAFVAALRPEQRAAFDAWQRQPTMERLSDFLAMLGTTQRAEFERLVGAGVVTVPRAQAAPRVVETTTVIHATPPGGQEPGAPAVPRAAPGMPALYAYPADVPRGLAVTARAEPAGSGLVVRYTIHNGLGVRLDGGRVAAADGHGAAVSAADDGPREVAPGADASGAVSVPASALPLTLHWTWARAAGQGTAEFYVLVTH
jgi:hypothetical protein